MRHRVYRRSSNPEYYFLLQGPKHLAWHGADRIFVLLGRLGQDVTQLALRVVSPSPQCASVIDSHGVILAQCNLNDLLVGEGPLNARVGETRILISEAEPAPTAHTADM